MNHPELSGDHYIPQHRLNICCQSVVATVHRPPRSIEDSDLGRDGVGQLVGHQAAGMLVSGQDHQVRTGAYLPLDLCRDLGGVLSPDIFGGVLPFQMRPASTAYLVLIFRGLSHRCLTLWAHVVYGVGADVAALMIDKSQHEWHLLAGVPQPGRQVWEWPPGRHRLGMMTARQLIEQNSALGGYHATADRCRLAGALAQPFGDCC